MTIETVHFQQFHKSVNNERIVSWKNQINVPRMTWAFKPYMTTSLTHSISVIRSHSEQGIIKTIFIGQFCIFIIDIRIIYLADTQFPDFVWIEETELDLRNFKPLPLRMNSISHFTQLKDPFQCWDWYNNLWLLLSYLSSSTFYLFVNQNDKKV